MEQQPIDEAALAAALTDVPYSHHRELIIGRIRRVREPVDPVRLARAVNTLYARTQPGRGFGPQGYEDVLRIVHGAVMAVTEPRRV